jgi:hypothetical protein
MKQRASLPWNSAERGSLAVVLFALITFTLWDFYIQGPNLRPFDFLAIAGLALAAAASLGGRFVLNTPARQRIAVVWIVVASYGVLGSIVDTDNARPVIGVLIGAIAFALGTAVPVTARRVLITATTVCIAIHCAAFWLQLIVYFSTGILINYHAWLGGEPRVFGTAFRACGLNLEPADFAVNLFMLVIIRFKAVGRVDKVSTFAVFSTFASLSLWGILAWAVLLVQTQWRTRAFWVCVALAFVAVLALLPVLEQWANSFWVAKRLLTLNSDPDTPVRYGVLGTTLVRSLWEPATWFGIGITNDYVAFGVSGIGYLIRATGVVGAAVFIMSMMVAAPRREKIFLTTATALALTATSLWTYMLWWFWLGLILRRFSREVACSAGERNSSAFDRRRDTPPALIST